MPVGPRLDAVQHHARDALDEMHLAGSFPFDAGAAAPIARRVPTK